MFEVGGAGPCCKRDLILEKSTKIGCHCSDMRFPTLLGGALLIAAVCVAHAEIDAIAALTGVSPMATQLHFGSVAVGEIPVSADNPFFTGKGDPLYTAMPDSILQALTESGCVWAWRRQQHAASALTDSCNAIIQPFLQSSWGAVFGVYLALVPNSQFLKPAASIPWAFGTNEKILIWTSDTTAVVNMSGSDRPEPPHLWDVYPGLNKRELEDLSSKGAKLPEAYMTHALGAIAFELLGGNETATDEKLIRSLKHCVELFFYIGNHAKQQDTSYTFLQDYWPSLLVNHLAHGAMYAYVKVCSYSTSQPRTCLPFRTDPKPNPQGPKLLNRCKWAATTRRSRPRPRQLCGLTSSRCAPRLAKWTMHS